MGDVALGFCVFLTDAALELGGDVVHQSLVEGDAGVKLTGRGGKCVVGVAAAGTEVVGDDGIGGLCVERLAVYVVDGDAVDGLGTVVGRAGIGLGICVIGLCGVYGVVDARNLGEAADGACRYAVGRSLESLEQLSAGDVHDCDGVAEGQNGVNVLLGDVARVYCRADAAAVCYCDDVLLVNGHAAGLLDGPDHGVGDEVAEVGLAVAVAVKASVIVISLVAVELYLVLCKYRAVFLVDGVGDGLSGCCDGLVLCRVCGDLNELVALDLLGRVVDDDNADVLECSAGGLDGLAALAGCHNGVGVAVDDEVNALEACPQIGRAVGLGLCVNAEVSQNDDNVGICLYLVGLSLNGLDHIVARKPGKTLDKCRVCLGLALGSVHADEADLQIADGDDLAAVEHGLAVLAEDVAADGVKLCFLEVLCELCVAVVKLVIAERGNVVACRVHHLDCVQTLVRADLDLALAEVACVGNYDLSALFFIVGCKRRHVCVARYYTVNVVRVQNNGLARHSGGLLVCEYGNCQGKYHGKNQQQSKKLISVFHVAPPDEFFSGFPIYDHYSTAACET